MLRQFVTRELLGRLAPQLEVPDPELRATLAASQLVGHGDAALRRAGGAARLGRPTRSWSAIVAPTLQRYLTGPTADSAPPPPRSARWRSPLTARPRGRRIHHMVNSCGRPARDPVSRACASSAAAAWSSATSTSRSRRGTVTGLLGPERLRQDDADARHRRRAERRGRHGRGARPARRQPAAAAPRRLPHPGAVASTPTSPSRENLRYFAAVLGAPARRRRPGHRRGGPRRTRATHVVGRLSGGQRARVSLAAALLGDARAAGPRRADGRAGPGAAAGPVGRCSTAWPPAA